MISTAVEAPEFYSFVGDCGRVIAPPPLECDRVANGGEPGPRWALRASREAWRGGIVALRGERRGKLSSPRT